MKKRLFNSYDAMTEDGYRLSDEIVKAIRPIIKSWLADGWDGRDVQSVAAQTVDGISAESILIRAMETRKHERAIAQAIAENDKWIEGGVLRIRPTEE